MGRYSGLVIIIPAYNEAGTIGKVVQQLIEFADVLVVDDKSTDATATVAKESGASYVVRNDGVNGYDNNLNCGFAFAYQKNYQWFVTCDADGEHSALDVRKICAALTSSQQKVDLVLGVRNRFQRIAEMVFAFFVSMLYGVKDPLCGLKGYSRKAYEGLGCFDQYGSIGSQLMLRNIKSGLKFEQIQIQVTPRLDAPRFGFGIRPNLKIIFSLIKWVFWYQFKK